MTPQERTEDLSKLNPTGRFSDRVGDYVRFRPTYPSAAIDAVLAGLGAPTSIYAADIGAGTGISSRLLSQRGVRTIAVEPNPDMRAAGAASPEACPIWTDGTAEATGLPTASFDLVLCAQAFHWFRQIEALREFARILTPGGRLALMWNCRDRHDAFTRGYTEAIVAIGGESRVETHKFDPEFIRATEVAGLFTPLTLTCAQHEQALDLDGLLGRAMSASYVPKSGPGHDRLVADLRALFARHAEGGLARLKYRTEVYTSTRLT